MAMNRMLGAGGLAVVLAITPLIADPAPGTLPDESTIVSGGVSESVHYLVKTYGVNEAEAMRRLKLQASAADMAEAVRAQLGEELFDVRLDQAGGGKLTFLTSSPRRAQQALGRRFDSRNVTLVQSKHTAAELRAAEAEVRGRLGVNARTGIDFRTGKIVVEHALSAAAKGSSIAALRSAVGDVAGAKRDVPVEVVQEPAQETGEEWQKTCTLSCPTPMRGGARLHVRRDNDTWGSCTAGFNVQDAYGWVYVLTAGHCATTPGPKRQYMYHNGLPAVWEKNSSGSAEDPNSPADLNYAVNRPPGLDYAVLPYQSSPGMGWSAYWLNNRPSKDLVESVCVSTAYGCSSGTYSLSGMYTRDQIQVGWVVCATGTGTAAIYSQNVGYTHGTRCGEIQCKTMYTYTACTGGLPGPNLWGLKANICSRPGDSGGPLFSQLDSRAYGILSGGPAGTGACGSSEYSVYTPLSQIFTKFNQDTGRGLYLIS